MWAGEAGPRDGPRDRPEPWAAWAWAGDCTWAMPGRGSPAAVKDLARARGMGGGTTLLLPHAAEGAFGGPAGLVRGRSASLGS